MSRYTAYEVANQMSRYTAYEVANQILQMRDYREVPVEAFGELPRDVLSALLWSLAEWRDLADLEPLLEMGANPHEEHDCYTVLEMFILGHDGYFRTGTPENISNVEEGVKLLVKFGVTRADFKHEQLLSTCDDIIKNSEYLCGFLGTELSDRVKFYYHLPRAEKLEEVGRTDFIDIDSAVKVLPTLTSHDQYIAVLEHKGKVTRYLVTKDSGPLAVIPMEPMPGWTKRQNMVSNIVNFVFGRDEYPTLPCENDD
jgi:hypothetical protein